MTTALAQGGAVEATTDVCLHPPASAMVWLAADQPHERIAVPGVVLREGEVLVTVELATICGSDVHTTRGHRSAPAPLVLGHEYVGRIMAIGSGGAATVDGRPLHIGDRVVWSIAAACGRCDRCRTGMSQKCRELRKYGHEKIAPRWELTGGFATHVHLRAGTAIVRVGEELSASVLAPASCGTATAWAALARAEAARGSRRALDGSVLLVSGAGLIGLTLAAMATDRGATVLIADPDPTRRALAAAFGAAAVVDPAGEGSLEAALAALGRDEIDIAIEASGAPGAVETALDSVAVGGVVVLVGSVFPGRSVPLDPERVVRNLLTVAGVHNYAPADLQSAVAYLLQRHDAYPFADLVSSRVPLDEIDRGIALAGTGGPIRVGVDPRA